MLTQVHTYITSQATRIYVSSFGTMLKGKLMWAVMEFGAHRVAMLLFAGRVVWGCAALHHMGGIYLFLSKYIQHFSREPEYLMQTLLSNDWALRTTVIIVNLKVRCWELKAPLNGKIKETISLLVVLSCWDENALLCVFVCACTYLEKKLYIHARTWTCTLLTHRTLSGEGTFSQNICDYLPEGHTLRKKGM